MNDARSTGTGRAAIELLRPWQWTKNVTVFAGVVFAHQWNDPSQLARALGFFFAFCGLSSVAYALNDVVDVARDRAHPRKRQRPLASGRLSTSTAVALAGALAGIALLIGWALGPRAVAVLLAYAALQLAYDAGLRHYAPWDVIVVASGFVLRVAGGAWILHVEVSPWLILCAWFLALLLAIGKRRHEWVALAENAATHRPALHGYNTQLLDQLLSVTASATVVSYGLYTLAEQTVHKHGSHLVWTLPWVVAGLFRYLHLVHTRDLAGEPDRMLWTDRPLLGIVVGWGISVWVLLAVAPP